MRYAPMLAWLTMFCVPQVFASDEIICDSASFKTSLAVGSDGYVASVILSNPSRTYFHEILELTDLSKNKRHVSIATRSVDLEVMLGKKNANRFEICLRNGEGYVKLDGHREIMTCDWKI